MTDRQGGIGGHLAPIKPATKQVRAALWSVYHHCLYVRALRRSVLNVVHTVEPMPLADAIQAIMDATDPQRVARQRRVLMKLARAGFANRTRWKELTDAAALVPSGDGEAWRARLKAVEAKVWLLAKTLHLEVEALGLMPVHLVGQYLEAKFLAVDPGCSTTNASLDACQIPNYKGFGRPLTTVTASADLTRLPRDLARVFDPRSWGSCFDHFETDRVDETAGGGYTAHQPDPDPIGLPWDPATKPHLIHEIVTLSDGTDENIFENVLEVTNFEVTDIYARLDFVLSRSLRLIIPSLAVDMPNCVTVDSGYLEATLLPSPGGTPLSRVTMVKQVQFVEISQGASQPFGLDAGEILNYLAPATLCMWLEDLTEGAVCCGP